MRHRRETPVRRVTNGKTRWVARYTDRDGNTRYAKPRATFDREWEAQQAIDAAYAAEDATLRRGPAVTFGDYHATWTSRHPRSERTNKTNDGRIRQLLDIPLEGVPLHDWPLGELRRRHAIDLVDHMLRHHGRAHTGAQNILRAVSAMVEDARTDDAAEFNFVQGVQVRASDPRVVGHTNPPRVFTFDELHRFAAAAGGHEPMVRVFADCGLRLGEALGLHRRDFTGDALNIRGSAHRGKFAEGDHPTKRHVRTVPVPPSTAQLIRGLPARIDTPVLFPTPGGRVWHESNFRRDVWNPLRKATGLDVRPQDCRHSWITNLRAQGIDAADLAQLAGHSVRTQTGTYTHALGRSNDAVRQAIG